MSPSITRKDQEELDGAARLLVPACTSGEEIVFDMGNITTTPGLKSWGYVRDDLKDLRVAYNHPTTGWTQIGGHTIKELQ